ncbi:MAG: GntR family transcriptional regulator [Bifidobacteriaceae bacterium]|nr:GntR family transcriptional regulator [Bifidobacteriaceae bacterium]MCI1978111.1 GntR family transcriptional regulator [Bifidobacteriaceae bacterium]
MKLIISSVSGTPIYEQIKTQIRSAILTGELSEGEVLPSLRSLAKELRISVLTVTRAYNELAAEGIIRNVQGKGSFVTSTGSDVMRRQFAQRATEALKSAAENAKAAGMGIDELHRILDNAYKDKA